MDRPRRPIKLAYLTVVHGRREVSVRNLTHVSRLRAWLSPGIDLCPLVVCSLPDAAWVSALAVLHSLEWSAWPNSPLSRKLQAGADLSRLLCPDADALLYCPGDDFLSPDCAELSARVALHEGGAGLDRCYMYDAGTRRLSLWVCRMRLPSGLRIPPSPGRCWSRRYLDALDWQLWPFDREGATDTYSSGHMQSNGLALSMVDLSGAPDAVAVDVKSRGSMHSYDHYADKGLLEPVTDPAEFARVLKLAGIRPSWWGAVDGA
jgi:hypothetical protein